MSPAPRVRATPSVAVLATLLAALAMIGPFAVDTYLPSFPAIQADLTVTAAEVQQTLSLYLIAFAVMTLFHGTLSDSLGRRPGPTGDPGPGAARGRRRPRSALGPDRRNLR